MMTVTAVRPSAELARAAKRGGDMTWSNVLQPEFNAEEGSFILTLRMEYRWDAQRFGVLTRAMWEACLATQNDESLPRWLAEGFWLICVEAPRIAAHPSFRKEHSDEYRARVRELLDGLGTSFFSGASMWKDEPEWA